MIKVKEFHKWAEEKACWLLMHKSGSELIYLLPNGFKAVVRYAGDTIFEIDNGQEIYKPHIVDRGLVAGLLTMMSGGNGKDDGSEDQNQ